MLLRLWLKAALATAFSLWLCGEASAQQARRPVPPAAPAPRMVPPPFTYPAPPPAAMMGDRPVSPYVGSGLTPQQRQRLLRLAIINRAIQQR